MVSVSVTVPERTSAVPGVYIGVSVERLLNEPSPEVDQVTEELLLADPLIAIETCETHMARSAPALAVGSGFIVTYKESFIV